MRGKNGQIFALYLVVITLTMCGVVAGLYYVQQQNIHGALVSPMGVLKERDSLEIFEGREIYFIKSSLKVADGSFGSDVFLSSFRKDFIDRIVNDEEMREFLFANLSISGIKIREQDKSRNLVESGIYPEIRSEFVDSQLVFARGKISKNYLLASKDESKINFPINFNFEFERTYLISDENGKFEVEVA